MKKKRDVKERRKAQRLNIPLRMKYKLRTERGVLEESIVQDISGGGIGLSLDKPLKKGSKLKVLIYFPDDPKPISAESQVVWCRKSRSKRKYTYNIGIKHLRIVPADRERFVFLFCETMINLFALGRWRV